MLNVVKIGGNVIDSEANLDKFLKGFASLPEPKILVHGGGKLASEMAERMGITPKMLDGRRITDKATLQVVAMVYAGWINKSVVAKLQAEGVNSLGLSGADANVVAAVKRPPHPIDYGYAGDIEPEGVNGDFLMTLIEGGITPVLCAITHDQKGSLLNTNADTIASTVAVAMSHYTPTKLTFCFDKNGVLQDPADDNSAVERITKESYLELKEAKIITDGMIPKIDNAFDAIEKGVKEVVIKSWADIGEENKGTKIY